MPDHWLRYEGRRSRLGSVSGNRKVERPVNALLYYLFALVEVEAVLACHRVGLDPGLGIMHLDAKSRNSMALDLMEPVRPAVEAWTLELVARRSFMKSSFTETADGHVRILAPLTHELADTIPQWRSLLAPWVEGVAHLLGQVVSGDCTPATPLNSGNPRRAQASVKVRKARAHAQRQLAQRATERAPRQPGGRNPHAESSGHARLMWTVVCAGTGCSVAPPVGRACLARTQHPGRRGAPRSLQAGKPRRNGRRRTRAYGVTRWSFRERSILACRRQAYRNHGSLRRVEGDRVQGARGKASSRRQALGRSRISH